MEELTKYQGFVLESIQQENWKLNEANKQNLEGMISKARLYQNKLTAIKKDMEMIKEKSEKLKKSALLLEQKSRSDALRIESERQRQIEREKQLLAVVRPKTTKSNS